MSEVKEFNPIATARKVEESYREYIATTIHFADADLQAQLEEILGQPGYLAKGPFLEAAPPYRKDKNVRQLVDEGVLCRSMLSLGGGDPEQFDSDRPLYVHQVRAIRKAASGHNYAVVTGTGSGKTECFLLPILNDILTEFEIDGPSAGVRAMILYPMNALANDQLKRLRTLLSGTDITFGRYTGDTEETESKARTKWREENPGQEKMPNEIISREAIRENPPNILLTNYSMLEYLLLRPEDAPLFGSAFGAKWRHIAIDEAHIYSGALGTEIAYLLRRLKARIESETGEMPQLHCYATSATIGSDKDMPKVATFAQDLFGEQFVCDGADIDVVTSKKDQPQDALDSESWGMLSLDTWGQLRKLLKDPGDVSASALREALATGGAPVEVLARMDRETPLMGLGRVLLGDSAVMLLVRRCESLLDLTDVSCIDQIGIPGLEGNNEGIRVLSAMVEVLSTAQRSKDVPILTSRYHSFLRAPEGIFLNLHTRRLTPHKTVAERYDDAHDTPIYEVSVCRHCGQAYALGEEQPDKEVPTAWLNPRHEGTDADDEFIPRSYYRILAVPDEKDPDEEVQWLCPICGSLHCEKTDGLHRFSHEVVPRIPVALNEVEGKRANEAEARCRHCGYQSRVAIQPMRVSPEAAGSVVCYDLVRDIPPFEQEKSDSDFDSFFDDDEERRAGSVICFSDKRQDAAFFAPAMDRTYGSITRRQLIREAVESKSMGGDGCSPSSVVSWIVRNANSRYPGMLGAEKQEQATAWVLDELAAEDSRNSLEGLSVVRIEPSMFNEGFEHPKVRDYVNLCVSQLCDGTLSWLTDEDYILWAKVCLETLRERGAIEVPEGVPDKRNNHEKRGNLVIMGGEDTHRSRDIIQFAGSSAFASENKRSFFIRKYARAVHGVEMSREDALRVLQSLYKFLVDYLLGYFKGEGYLVGAKESVRQKFRLNKDIWTMYPHHEDDVVYRCDTCGCETHLDTNGVCMTTKCTGHMRRMTFAQAKDKDRFYKVIYQEEALPLRIEEHTAQLSSRKAREIQSDFIKGDVNVLSCTTTFELGVDVGDLRAIFMRNVPPSTANYTQRAGRVGRRAGKPGYAITFARLRPHDIAHFDNPNRIIAGETCVPMCYLNNDAIAIRHVYAVAMSEFFRFIKAKKGAEYSQIYNDFMELSKEEPFGLLELRDYLNGHPDKMYEQLRRVIPDDLPVADDIDLASWGWVEKLVGKADEASGKDGGRLVLAHSLKHADFARIQEGIDSNINVNDYLASNLLRSRDNLTKEKTISVLAENGILPKYGFPTDLVELHLPAMEQSVEENRLSLSRGMRQAIREYAPGSEIVAGKKLWKSVGIKCPKGHKLNVRMYGVCPECGTFVWPIDNFSDMGKCPVCDAEFRLGRRMLVPSYGFTGKEVKKGIGLRKPRSRGYAQVFFSQHWPNEVKTDEIKLGGGTVRKRYLNNGQLCVLNEPAQGIQVCSYCGGAAVSGEEIEHQYWCKESGKAPNIAHYSALGASFVSDVLELTINLDSSPHTETEEWESVMWAVFAAAARILEIPETELGGTFYENEMHTTSILIYDDVPGGAGHARQLSAMVEELVNEAYCIVDGHCGCGGETCCYGCIANYYNQTKQAVLSRGAAKKILGALLGGSPGEALSETSVASNEVQANNRDSVEGAQSESLSLRARFDGTDLSGVGFGEACQYAKHSCGSEAERLFIDELSVMGEGCGLEIPQVDVTFEDADCRQADASLAWQSARVAVLSEASVDEFVDSYGEFNGIAGWSVFFMSQSTPENVIGKLKESL